MDLSGLSNIKEKFTQWGQTPLCKFLFFAGLILVLIGVITLCVTHHHTADNDQFHHYDIVEDNPVTYPGRTIKYAEKFRDNNHKHLKAAKAIGLQEHPKDRAAAERQKKQLRLIQSTENYILDSLTHSVPYLVPKAAAELDSIGVGFANILARNGLPHYRFRVTSILRTDEDIKSLQKSGNINSVSNSAHCYGTTFDIAYLHYDKVTRTRDYVPEDNLKLILAQVLLNEQRAGHIYVKYEWKQGCFHITTR